MKVTICVIAALVAVAAAQAPKPCQAPREFEAKVRLFDTLRQQVFEEAFLTYDETNQRKRYLYRSFYAGTQHRGEVIELWNTKERYELDFINRTCTRSTITSPFIPHSVVENATFDGDFIIGSGTGESGLEVSTWSHKFDDIEWAGTFTRVACIPLRSVDYRSNSHYRTEDLFDVTLGISDPNVFIPPQECS